ncbi:MAG: endonuclease domain-containing protein [Burkholderiales bacterium]|nr:endonuclease domain-containing protein [Burkholderiales bacterium]
MKGNTQRGKTFARKLRKSETDAERKIWQQLHSRNLKGSKFRRQHPVGPYVVDFICINEKLIIELDGSQHQKQQGYDAERTAYLEQAGYRVLRFWDNDVLLRTESVMQAIFDAILISPHPNPLPTSVGRGSSND